MPLNDIPLVRPPALQMILADAARLGFALSCEERTGSLLATLAASKPNGRFLELGTGAGAGTAWMLHGMDAGARLTTVELNSAIQAVAIRHLSADERVTFEDADADTWLSSYDGPPLDLVFVDCRPGKFHRLADLLGLLRPGGIYVVDDLLPQPTWPADHQTRVDAFLERLHYIPDLRYTPILWASGLVLGVRL